MVQNGKYGENNFMDIKRLSSKTILVTGGVGFIGGHLVEELLKLNVKVIIPYIDLDKRSTFFLNDLSKKVTLIPLDITDKKKVLSLIKNQDIDYIFHLAAQTLVTEAYRNPLGTFEANIMGTIYLLEAVRLTSHVKGIIIASSDKAYGKTNSAYTEEHPLRGDHPYDVSKSSADLIAQTYYKTYHTPVVVTRFGNVYGEGDLHFDRIVPGICEAILKKDTLKIRSDGKYVRDYIYVKDVVTGYIFLLQHIERIVGQAFNFSSKDTLSVLDVVRKAENALKIKIPYSIENTARNEIPYQHLDDTKIRELGWKTQYGMEKTFPNILLWYKKLLETYDI